MTMVKLQSARVEAAALDQFQRRVLEKLGCDGATVDAVSRVLMHAGRFGIDSHGARLLPHYVQVFEGGRVNPRPEIRLARTRGGSAVLDADDGHGATAGYRAMEEAVSMAREAGLGAVAVARSSHFGAAGAYVLAAAEAGMMGLAVCNANSIVQLHGSRAPFHGTNPIAFAAPVAGERPWLLDMATSSIPLNRVLLYRSTGETLPEGVAADETGHPTSDAQAAVALLPLGGPEYGYKGAALAGLIDILSAGLTGMGFSYQLPRMGGPDFSTPRGLGQFFLAIDPEAFLPRDTFEAAMRGYVAALRASPPAGEEPLMAPGDREWAEADRRAREGIPLDPATIAAFAQLADRFGIARLV